jgi:hypothetical protein
MVKRAWVALLTVCSLAILTRAQEQPSSEIAMLPMGRGVYYQSPAGWTSLPFTILIPSINAGGWTLWPSTTVVEIRSPHPEVRVSTFKPTLYLRGISAAVPIYLVREIQVNDFRKLRLNLRRDEQEWSHFIDTVPCDIVQLDGGVVRIRPREDLPAATYALATGFDKSSRSIFLGFEFEVSTSSKP